MPVQKRTRYRPSRSRGLRANTGCSTCRTRHLKCDETKPICISCQKGGRPCEYSSQTDATSNASTNGSGRHDIQPECRGSASSDHSNVGLTSPRTSTTNTAPSLSEDRVVQIPQTTSPGNVTLQPHFDERLRDSVIAASGGSASLVRTNSKTLFHPQTAVDFAQVGIPYGDGYHSTTSPHTITSNASGIGIEDAAAHWFDLLAGDARLEFEDHGEREQQLDPESASEIPSPPEADDVQQDFSWRNAIPTSGTRIDPIPVKGAGLWRSPHTLELHPHELRIFENFIYNVASWIDLLDPFRHYSLVVPRLALRNVGLLNAILALSTRHLSLNHHLIDGVVYSRNEALQYYHSSLKYVRQAMQHDDYNTSDELLATALIISAYEMLDGGQRDWESHLQGVFGIQRSQVIHGDSGGLRGATWWAWLAQDCWAAFRDKRKPFTFWRPQMTDFTRMSSWSLAARSQFVFAKVVRFCAQGPEEPTTNSSNDYELKSDQARVLSAMLDDWKASLPIDFSPLPTTIISDNDNAIFPPINIHPPAFAIALQLHHAARILLSLHRPFRGGMAAFLDQQKMLTHCVAQICGIAKGLREIAASIMSAQCLFIAGTCVHNGAEREEVIRLMAESRARTGWPVRSLEEDLRVLWGVVE
ncbi:hypothetical protein K402DRAFT_393293 [Aulographum hederae CBS 113979]|uniref:Zn(2)-C6 fungal-type domain-containing protein n=1 Tax=Aulographum hederae CBS 113979 TaxID=1176131 RepID=A0A6G1H289_9PEZI|nr:hypothetical protein K402DRAFT_393293 [Aulographum hederae CBS 113979]